MGFQQIQHEDGTLDLANFLKRNINLILTLIGGQFLQDQGWRNLTGVQRGNKADNFVPMRANNICANSFSQKRNSDWFTLNISATSPIE